jgi:hypothetical protein
MWPRALRVILVACLSLGVTAPAAADEPDITIAIDRFGSYGADGQAFITGTIICDPEVGGLSADVYVRQRVGGRYTDGSGIRGFTDGYGYTDAMICDGTLQRWIGSAVSRDVDDEGNFIYKAGPAYARVFTFGGEASAEGNVILRPSR